MSPEPPKAELLSSSLPITRRRTRQRKILTEDYSDMDSDTQLPLIELHGQAGYAIDQQGQAFETPRVEQFTKVDNLQFNSDEEWAAAP